MAAGSTAPTHAGPGLMEPAGRRPRRAAYVAIAIAAALVLLVGLVVLATRLGGGDPAPAATASASPTESTPPTTTDIFNAVGPSVVVIETASGGLGTGTVVSEDGGILTANHVISDGSALTVTFYDGTETSATVSSSEPDQDIATLLPDALPEVLVPATLGGAVQAGSEVVAIGNPLGLTYSVSTGVVSGLDRAADGEAGKLSGLIQFDASVNPGSSGGPLLDGNGVLVGVVVAIADPGKDEAFAGIGFAVPVGTAVGTGGAGDGPQI